MGESYSMMTCREDYKRPAELTPTVWRQFLSRSIFIAMAILVAFFVPASVIAQGHMRLASAICEETAKAGTRGAADATLGRSRLEGIRAIRDFWRRYRDQSRHQGYEEDIIFRIEELSVTAYYTNYDANLENNELLEYLSDQTLISYFENIKEDIYQDCIRNF